MLKQELVISKSNLKDIDLILKSHMENLNFPMDSYLEDRLDASEIFEILLGINPIGYAGVEKGELIFFHIIPKYFKHASDAFEFFIKNKNISKVHVMTQDNLFCSLMVEWDYKKEKEACWFIDAGRLKKPNTKSINAIFRTALVSDIDIIIKETGEFFDKLEKRINEKTIFMLEESGELLGCGIIEHGRYCEGFVSIGMICLKKHRQKGVGQTILWYLKEHVYKEGKTPIAGCWFYNILSRKTLESAGMIAASKGYIATLTGKETPPLRTGNPPGKLV